MVPYVSKVTRSHLIDTRMVHEGLIMDKDRLRSIYRVIQEISIVQHCLVIEQGLLEKYRLSIMHIVVL